MKKTILVLMPTLFDLHNQVLRALNKLDFEADYLEDYQNIYSPLYRESKLKLIKKILFYCFKINKNRLKRKKIYKYEKKYDYFLCVNGFSFDKTLINNLKKNNPNIKTILYLYDSTNYFDFTNYFNLFDKVYTFDYLDSQKYNLKLLPLFWDIVEIPIIKNDKYTYDLFFVGKIHSDRFKILSNLYSQAKQKGLNAYIKLYVDLKRISSTYFRIKYNLLSFFSKNYKEKWRLLYLIGKRKIQSDILIFEPIDKVELDTKMAESSCVIDIELPTQSGLSNRLIQTLAMNKKLLTTNQYIKDTNLYNESMIAFIERNNPNIPIDFIKSKNIKLNNIEIENLRIDNWLKTLLLN